MHPRNLGSDKIVRKYVRPPLYVSLGEVVHFKHPCILVVNHMLERKNNNKAESDFST